MNHRYVSASALDRIAKCIPIAYHASAKCGFLTKSGTEFCELSDTDLVQYEKYLKPCQRCHPKENTTKRIVEEWPKAEVITIWHCSDKREFTSEIDALRHELSIFRKG
jgi:hypothetical protein